MEENISIDLNTEEIIEEEDPTSVIAQLRRIQELNKDGDFLKKEDLDYIKNYDRKVYGRKFSSDEEDFYQKKTNQEQIESDEASCSDEFYYDSETGEFFEIDFDEDGDRENLENQEEVEDYYDEEEENEKLKSMEPPSALDKFKAKSNSGESKVHDFIDVDYPILMSMTRVWFEEGRKIGTLPLVAIADQLDVPETCSIGSWREVANYFKISPQLFLNLEANPNTACLDLLEHLREEKAQKLVYSLESIRRLDVLAFLKIFRNQRQNNAIFNLEAMSRTNSMNSGVGFSEMSTGKIGESEIIAAPVQSPLPIKKNGKILAGPPIILINHVERTALDVKNYRWLVKNLKSNLKNFHFQIVDIAELMDDFSKILEIYQNSTHVLICYNKTYLNMLNEEEEIWKFRKFVHQQTQSEFFSQGMKNLRCRSVLMPGITTSESTGWAPVTHQYAFPSDLQGLLNRIIDSKNTI